MSNFFSTLGIRRERGLTLIELMVALALALAIVAGVGYVYLQGKDGYRVQDNRSRLQEDARTAFSVMQRDILMAGYFGCVKAFDDPGDPASYNIRISASQPLMTENISWLQKNNDETQGSRALSMANVVRGYENGSGWPVETSSALATSRLSGTDTLLLLRGGDDARHLSEAVEGGDSATEFKITSEMVGVKKNGRARPLVISSCKRGEIVKPTIKNGGLLFSVDNTLNKNNKATVVDTLGEENTLRYATDYGPSGMVTTFEPVSYYIALAKGPEGRSVPSLHRLTTKWDTDDDREVGKWKDSGDVVIHGVERLQLGFMTEGTTEGTSRGPFKASQVAANGGWHAVNAVIVELTMVSDQDNVRTEQTTQTVGGTSTTDSRLRLTTSFTVNIRNPRT
jgi:type IV pilus assembly protein PilW